MIDSNDRLGAMKASRVVSSCFSFMFVLCLAATGVGLAQIGQPPEAIVTPMRDLIAERADDGWYVGDDGFRFRVIDRGGLAFRLEGEGELTGENTAFAAAAIGYASGLGDDIRGPVQAFFAERSAELVGQGQVAVGLDAFVLSMEIEGEPPYNVTFSLAFAQVDPVAFLEARHAMGPEDAAYVIREFSDFQCPFCANYALEALPFIKGVLLERSDVRFEYHHFPLQSIHANAVPAAEAAECVTDANDADAFWPYHDALFERQRAWAQLGEPAPYFVRLAADIGLDIDGVAACIEDRTHADVVADSYRVAAGDLSLGGTPTVFVNGFRVGEFLDIESYLALFERIDAFREAESTFGGSPVDQDGER